MRDENESAIDRDPDGDHPVPAVPAPPPPPLVIIEYRNRSLPSILVPPILILLLALAILSYQRQRPIPALGSALPPTVVPPPPPVASSPARPPETGPIVVRSLPAAAVEPDPFEYVLPVQPPAVSATVESTTPSPTPSEVATSPAAPPPIKAEDKPGGAPPPAGPLAHVEGPRAAAEAPRPPHPDWVEPFLPRPQPPREPLPAASTSAMAVAVPTPVAPPEPSKEEVLAEIRREAEEKHAERKKLEGLGPQLRFAELLDRMRKAQERRIPFHNDLREVLRARGAQAGPEIEALSGQYGRTAEPELKDHINRLLKTTYARQGLKVKAEMMRSYGLPESMVLDYVATTIERRSLGTRGGPRTRDEVWIRAAKVLLGMPPAAPAHAAAAPPLVPAPRPDAQ